MTVSRRAGPRSPSWRPSTPGPSAEPASGSSSWMRWWPNAAPSSTWRGTGTPSGAAWREPSPRPNPSGGPPLPTVAETVGAVLAGLGVRDVFGLVGSGNFVVTNSLVAAGAAFIASRHEGGAVAMADAYARVSGRLGVCSVHQGPGL